MSESKDWLDEEFPETEAQGADVTEQAEAQAPEPEDTPEPEEQVKAEAAPEQSDAPKEEIQQAIPLAVHLSEREKRQEAERAKQEVERKLAELESRQREQEKQRDQKPVDPIDDPEGWARQQQDSIRQAELNAVLRISQASMQRQLGDEEFRKLGEWWRAETARNPHLLHRGFQEPDPWQFALQQYQQHNTLSAVGSDLSAYKESLRQEILAELKAKQEAELAPQADKQAPPPSLAKGGAGGTGERELTDKEVFNEVFGG